MKHPIHTNVSRVLLGLAPAMLLTLGACSMATSDAPVAVRNKVATIAKATTPLPHIGLYAYTHAHALNPNPPDRWGGAVTVTANQMRGATQWVLPGPRDLDPAVFGTPDHPVGWEQAPFPLIGVPPSMRQSMNGHYTIADHATPFSNWRAIGMGGVKMSITDITAIDGATTKDKIDFVATFDSPDKMHSYKVYSGPLRQDTNIASLRG